MRKDAIIDTRRPNSPMLIRGVVATPLEVKKPIFDGFPMRAITQADIDMRKGRNNA